MFDNIGEKIKVLAYVACLVGIVFSVIFGFIVVISDSFWVGLLIVVLGSLTAWVSSFTLYGFGEIIEQLKRLNTNSKKTYDLLNNRYIKIPINASQPTEKTTEAQGSDEMPTNVSQPTEKTAKARTSHKWLCHNCGNFRSQSPCPYCGNE